MLSLTTPATTTLVTLAQLKEHLNIEHTLDDDRLELLLDNASDQVERDSNLTFRSQVWTQTRWCFGNYITLGVSPVTSVVVTYYDSDNASQTLSSDDYYLSKNAYEAVIYPVESFPDSYYRPDSVTIAITAGGTIPAAAKQATLLLCGAWNENREGEIAGTISTETKLGYERLIKSIRKGFIG